MQQKDQVEINMDEETVNIFIPAEIKKRGGGGVAMVIIPKTPAKPDEKSFDDTMLKSIARAYKWKTMIDEGEVTSLADISRKENLSTGFVTKIFSLNFLSPKIVEMVLKGIQPRELRLQDIVTSDIPDSWEEQAIRWGFLKI